MWWYGIYTDDRCSLSDAFQCLVCLQAAGLFACCNHAHASDSASEINVHAVNSGSILAAWQQSNHAQKKHLLDMLVRQVHDISEEEAQALPDKDVDISGLYDRVLSWINTKVGRK